MQYIVETHSAQRGFNRQQANVNAGNRAADELESEINGRMSAIEQILGRRPARKSQFELV